MRRQKSPPHRSSSHLRRLARRHLAQVGVDGDGHLPLQRRRQQRGRAGPRRGLLQHARRLVSKVPRDRRAGPRYDVRGNLRPSSSLIITGLGNCAARLSECVHISPQPRGTVSTACAIRSIPGFSRDRLTIICPETDRTKPWKWPDGPSGEPSLMSSRILSILTMRRCLAAWRSMFIRQGGQVT